MTRETRSSIRVHFFTHAILFSSFSLYVRAYKSRDVYNRAKKKEERNDGINTIIIMTTTNGALATKRFSSLKSWNTSPRAVSLVLH